jgi:hypothetical protein
VKAVAPLNESSPSGNMVDFPLISTRTSIRPLPSCKGVSAQAEVQRGRARNNAALHPARRQTCLPAATDRRRRSPILPAPSSTPSQPRSQPRSAFFLSPPAHPTAPCHRSLLAPSRHSPAAVWCHAPTSAHTRLSVCSLRGAPGPLRTGGVTRPRPGPLSDLFIHTLMR